MKKDKPQPGSRKKALPKNRYRVQEALRPEFYQAVREILAKSRANVYSAVNFAMVEAEAQVVTAPLGSSPADFIKDPYVLEFLGLPDAHAFREAELEQAIIGKLQSFMLELGKGFAFVSRQKLICTDTKDREKALILREGGVRYA